MLEALLEREPTIVADANGWRPLHVACDAGNHTAVSQLLADAPGQVSVGTVRRWLACVPARCLPSACVWARAENLALAVASGAA